MNRHLFMSIILLCLSACALADDDLPVVEMKADRTMIYPQRMELTGEETLMDVLLMVPDLMIANYEDVIAGYNLRIDNGPVNGDTRLVLSQMKAKDIAKIQVCDNTGVAKGTTGTGRVLDINMVAPDALQGFVASDKEQADSNAESILYDLQGRMTKGDNKGIYIEKIFKNGTTNYRKIWKN